MTKHLPPLVLGLATLLLPAGTGALAQVPLRNLELKAHFNDYPPQPGYSLGAGYASCWCYIHGDGREYAAIGAHDGTAIYNVTNPDNAYRVGFIPGPPSLWREMKSYRQWLYVVTEANAPSPGLQIIRMSDPEHPVLAATYTTGFQTSHTVSVDTSRALLFCNGTRAWPSGSAQGMRILSLASPEAPVEVGYWPQPPLSLSDNNYYTHDCVAVANRLYLSNIYAGRQRVLDITNPASPTVIADWTYPNAFYSHSSWPDPSGNFLYVCDEQNGQPVRVFNISNLAAPQLVYQFSSNPQAIVHNPHVKGNELYLASYTEGLRVMDISDPAHPAEFAWGDSYPGASGGFGGVWGACPYFPSGTVIASDMQTGLYVYRPVRNYGLVRVKVDSAGSAAQGVKVYVAGDSLVTTADGVVEFAPNPGTHTVLAHKFGFTDASAMVTVSPGSRDTVNLTLVPKPRDIFEGTVTSTADQSPLPEAEVNLAYTPVHEHTEADGSFHIEDVPDDFYHIEVRRPGYRAVTMERTIGPGPTSQSFALQPTATWDNLSTGTGWVVGAVGDDAFTGTWIRVEPLGTGVSAPVSGAVGTIRPPARGASPATESWDPNRQPVGLHEGHESDGAPFGPAQPEYDRSPAPDSMCYVTGQGVNPSNIDEADVDGGRTSLTSPVLNLSGMIDPTIGWWQWFYTQFSAPEDWLAVLISNDNGASWVPVDTTRGMHNHWYERTIRVADYLAPTSQMKLRFVAADLGAASVVEAAIDDIVTYDAAISPVAVRAGGGPARLAFRAPRPNPSPGPVSLVLDVPRAERLEVEVLDLAGRRVRVLHHGAAVAGPLALRWDGADDAGRPAPAGVYFARAKTATERVETRFARVK